MTALQPALQYSRGRSYKWAGASLVNCFSEKGDGDKQPDFAVMASPGLDLWATVGKGPIRGSIVCAGVLYVVSGKALYSIDATGAASELGAIPGKGTVSMAANYADVAIAANGIGFVWDGSSLSTPCPFAAASVVYADNYMLWTIPNSEQFFISAPGDALTYDASNIASAEGFPDDLVGVVNNHREIMLFGSSTTEVFYDSGADFPFQRQGNAFIERGCLDGNSIVKIDNSVNFVGDDRIVYVMNGYQPERISTHAIEYELRDTPYATGFTYTQEGHKFYCLETSRGTFLYDHATGTWHKRQSWQQQWWRVGGAVQTYGLTLLTDRATGQIYTPSLESFTEVGESIAVDITLPKIIAQRGTLMRAFGIEVESGVGNDASPDPQMMMTYSDDGGHRWSNEMWRSMGKIGEYRTRAVWRGLGQFDTRVIRLRITDTARKMVLSYFADFG